MKLFVYGTLLRGLELHSLLADCPYLGPAVTAGCLYDLGEYPGLIAGNDRVSGEIYEVDAATLRRLDAVEGVVEGDPAQSLYQRVAVSVTYTADGRVESAELYRYNRTVAPEHYIAGADYRAYRLNAPC